MPTSAGPVSRFLDTASPEALFVLSAVAQYLGASIAVVLFDEVQPQTVAWFRMIGAALAVLVGAGALVYGLACFATGAFRVADMRGLLNRRASSR